MSTSVDVLARKVFEEYSRASGNPPDAHFDRNAAEQWMAHALEFAGVAELIEADKEYDEAWLDMAGRTHTALRREKAGLRRAAALSRVKGA